MEVVDVAEDEIGALRAQRLHAEPVRQVHRVQRFERRGAAADSRRVLAVAVTLEGGDVGLVEGGEMAHSIAETACDEPGVAVCRHHAGLSITHPPR